MTSSPPTRRWPGQRMVLVPTLGDQLLAPLAVLEELLTDLAAWEHEDAADPFPARQAPRLPAPLARRMALDAVWRLRAALTPSQCLGVECGRLLRSAGRGHAPLSVVVLAAGDIAVLSATARVLGHPGLNADVAALLDAYAHQDGDSRGQEDRAGFIARLAAIAGLLDLAPTEQSRMLITRLTGRRPERDQAWTEAEQAAYAHTLDRMTWMWSLGCALPWHLY
jgi:hypothetical protein